MSSNMQPESKTKRQPSVNQYVIEFSRARSKSTYSGGTQCLSCFYRFRWCFRDTHTRNALHSSRMWLSDGNCAYRESLYENEKHMETAFSWVERESEMLRGKEKKQFITFIDVVTLIVDRLIARLAFTIIPSGHVNAIRSRFACVQFRCTFVQIFFTRGTDVAHTTRTHARRCTEATIQTHLLTDCCKR